MSVTALDLVPIDELEEYPLGPEDRVDSHSWIAWPHRRWLHSPVRLKGLPECRALHFDLICLSQDETPLGTLPTDTEILAKNLNVSEPDFKRLCALDYGPLHGWKPVRCDDEVRLFHPLVLEIALDALSRKEDNRARNEAANRKKRLQRLRAVMMGYHKELGQNDAAVEWIDEWLGERCTGNRTASWVERAIEAWTARTLGHRLHGKPPRS